MARIRLNSLAFLAVNEAATRTYGYSRDEFLSMTINNIRGGVVGWWGVYLLNTLCYNPPALHKNRSGGRCRRQPGEESPNTTGQRAR